MSLTVRRLLSSSLIYTIGDFVVMGVTGFLLIPVYLRNMSPAEYGIYGTVSTLILLQSVVTQFGLHSALARFYYSHRDKNEHAAYMGALWLRQTGIAGLVLLTGALVGPKLWHIFLPEIPANPYFWLILITSLTSFSAGLYSIWLRITEKPNIFVAVQLTNTISLVVLIYVLVVRMGRGPQGAVEAFALTNALMALISLVALAPRVRWTLRCDGMGESFKYGLWIMLGTAGYYILNRVQILALQHYTDMTAVGVFNVVIQLSSIIILVSGSFSKAWQPLIYSAPDEASASRVIGDTSRVYIGVVAYLTLILTLFAADILHIVAPPAYHHATPLLQMALGAAFIYCSATLPASALLYKKRPDITQFVILSCAGLNIVLNAVFVSRFQMAGAVIAMITANSLFTLITFIAAQRCIPVQYQWSKLGRIAGVAIVTLLPGILLAPTLHEIWSLALRVLLVALFPILLVAAGVLSREEVNSVTAGIGSRLGRKRRQTTSA